MLKRINGIGALFRKIYGYAKAHPIRTTLIVLGIVGALVGLGFFIRAYLGLIVTLIFVGCLIGYEIYLRIPQTNTSALFDKVFECVYMSVLDLYVKLKVRRPKIILEINPTPTVNGIDFNVVKEQPSVPIEKEELIDMLFLLQDKARHYCMMYGCQYSVVKVDDVGGYLLIKVVYGIVPHVAPVICSPDNRGGSTPDDGDF
jgi:hypothetical protein